MDTSVNFELGTPDTEDHLTQSSQFTVGDILRKSARIWPDRPALVGEDGSQSTYRELNERVNMLVNSLRSRGVGYGDRFAVISPNRPEYAELLYAGAKLGALVPCINWRLAEEKLIHCLDIANPDLIFVSESEAEKRSWIERNDSISADIINLDGESNEGSYRSFVSDGSTAEPELHESLSPEDGLAVLYTSGTTGLPKGAVVSHRAFLSRAHAMGKIGIFSRNSPDFVAWAPMFHMASTDPLFAVGLYGGTFYTIDGFDFERIIGRLVEADNGWLQVLPGTYKTIFDYAEENSIPDEASASIKYIGSMPDLVAPEKVKELTELFDANHLNSFGSTETGLPPATNNSIPIGTIPDEAAISKTENQLCRIKLVDENGDLAPVGEVGELLIQGPTLFSGYLHNPEANREAFDDGWFAMGDMFVRNDDGSLDFVDRKKYLIKSGGENIYPAEIEQVLMDHEAVNEAIVVGVDDDKWGEVPKAYVASAADVELSEEDILAYLDGNIARYKLPHYLEFVDMSEFPRSTTGEIVRSEVEKWPVSDQYRVRNP